MDSEGRPHAQLGWSRPVTPSRVTVTLPPRLTAVLAVVRDEIQAGKPLGFTHYAEVIEGIQQDAITAVGKIRSSPSSSC
jgi:hypothetical protein